MSDEKTTETIHNNTPEDSAVIEANLTEDVKGDPVRYNGYTYAILVENDEETGESLYNFIKYEENEIALEHLRNVLESVEWVRREGYSTFDICLDDRVSSNTAYEMTIPDMNSLGFHRRFDGKLQMIDFGINAYDKPSKIMRKVNKLLGQQGIEDFIDGEVVVDANNELSSDSEDVSEDVSEESTSESSSDDEDEEDENENRRKYTHKGKKVIPGQKVKIPRQAAARRFNKKKRENGKRK